ncbi:type I restriction endonuclease [Stutzerimonas sp. KH-1]
MRGGHERRPDLVNYLNGIAVGVIELKRSSVDVADGIYQLITKSGGNLQPGVLQYGAAGFCR